MENKTARMPRNYISKDEIKGLIKLGCEFDPSKSIMEFKGLVIELGPLQNQLIAKYIDKFMPRVVSKASFIRNERVLQNSFGSFSETQANNLIKSGKWFYVDEDMDRIHNGKLFYKIIKESSN